MRNTAIGDVSEKSATDAIRSERAVVRSGALSHEYGYLSADTCLRNSMAAGNIEAPEQTSVPCSRPEGVAAEEVAVRDDGELRGGHPVLVAEPMQDRVHLPSGEEGLCVLVEAAGGVLIGDFTREEQSRNVFAAPPELDVAVWSEEQEVQVPVCLHKLEAFLARGVGLGEVLLFEGECRELLSALLEPLEEVVFDFQEDVTHVAVVPVEGGPVDVRPPGNLRDRDVSDARLPEQG